MNSLYATRTKIRSAKARPISTHTADTVQVAVHGVPIEPGVLHTLVESVSTAVEERLDASDHLLHQAIDAVVANVTTIDAADTGAYVAAAGISQQLPSVLCGCTLRLAVIPNQASSAKVRSRYMTRWRELCGATAALAVRRALTLRRRW